MTEKQKSYGLVGVFNKNVQQIQKEKKGSLSFKRVFALEKRKQNKTRKKKKQKHVI